MIFGILSHWFQYSLSERTYIARRTISIIFLRVSFVTETLLYSAAIQRSLELFKTVHFSCPSNTSNGMRALNIQWTARQGVKSNINIWGFPESSLNLIMFQEAGHLLGANSFAHDLRISIIFSTKQGGHADWILIQPFFLGKRVQQRSDQNFIDFFRV